MTSPSTERAPVDAAPKGVEILNELEAVLVDRRDAPPAGGSYSAGLVRDPVAVQRKVMEEAFELCLELGRPGELGGPVRQRTAEEAADLIFHVLAGLVGARVPLADVLDELAARRRSAAPSASVQSAP